MFLHSFPLLLFLWNLFWIKRLCRCRLFGRLFLSCHRIDIFFNCTIKWRFFSLLFGRYRRSCNDCLLIVWIGIGTFQCPFVTAESVHLEWCLDHEFECINIAQELSSAGLLVVTWNFSYLSLVVPSLTIITRVLFSSDCSRASSLFSFKPIVNHFHILQIVMPTK